MITLQIVADGKNDGDRANKRGRLFEDVCATVLRAYGFEIDNTRTVRAGMEIDIEGHHSITHTPLYAECKCYTDAVSSPQLQAFTGKYMAMWLKNRKAVGLFVAIPNVTSSAKGFFEEYLKTSEEVTLRLLQETHVIQALVDSPTIVSYEVISAKCTINDASPGDAILICSDRGFFWAQYLIPCGTSVPTAVKLFDAKGNQVRDSDSYQYFAKLIPEIGSFTFVSTPEAPIEPSNAYDDPVVELRGSRDCFEYQFPASPKFFVGRENLLSDFERYMDDVRGKRKAARAVLFQGNSGWGKSSLVLACCNMAMEAGHYAVSLDARSALNPSFLLSATNHVLQTFGNFHGAVTHAPRLGGVESAVDALLEIGRNLESQGKLLIVFFDQFENVFYQETVLEKISQAVLRVTDAQTNVIFGFAWKSDLVGLTETFPFELKANIVGAAQAFHLDRFSKLETKELLCRLSDEMRVKLRDDLRFQIADFSQGYPWLLRKLSAHVRTLLDQGVSQHRIARDLLNVEDLFEDDLRDLTDDQRSALKLIAWRAVNAHELPEEIHPATLQSLINARLVIKVGNRHDIYWDIFRDYLNTGSLPVDGIYLLRAPYLKVLEAAQKLNSHGGQMHITELADAMSLKVNVLRNYVRDLRLLGLATFDTVL